VLAAAVAAGVAIALRRQHPFAVLTLAVGTQVALLTVGPGDKMSSPFVAILVVLYTLLAYGPVPRAWTAAAIAVALVGAALVATGYRAGLLALGFFAVAACAGGLLERVARHQAEELLLIAARLQREHAARARLAVIDERSRVARELHDSVAHAVSVMVLQAGAAEQVLASTPERARAAARSVEAQGRRALGELQEVLGVLHGDGEPRPRAPQPNLTALDALIHQASKAGLRVELRIHGHPPTLPVGVELAAYRIIQEALTNTLKHAGPVRVTVTLDFTPHALVLAVVDDGGNRACRPVEGAGHGMIGMRERVALYDGDLRAGPRPFSGYEVRARLPLRGAVT